MTTHWTAARWIIQSVINKLMYAPWHQKSVILATRKIRNKETTASFIFSFYLYCHIFVCTIHFALFLFHSTLKTKSLDQSSFQLTYDKPKPKQSQRPIITKINTIISQLKLKVITGKLPKGRETLLTRHDWLILFVWLVQRMAHMFSTNYGADGCWQSIENFPKLTYYSVISKYIRV